MIGETIGHPEILKIDRILSLSIVPLRQFPDSVVLSCLLCFTVTPSGGEQAKTPETGDEVRFSAEMLL